MLRKLKQNKQTMTFITTCLHIYFSFTHIVLPSPPAITRARRGGQSGKVTPLITIKLKEAMKIILYKAN